LTKIDEMVQMLKEVESMIVVLGYGLVVAQSNIHSKTWWMSYELTTKKVLFDIHPVPGQMPGQLNVLFAEAGCPYDIVEQVEQLSRNGLGFGQQSATSFYDRMTR
jgi:NAD/NADP transhydrogenase beta subunit